MNIYEQLEELIAKSSQITLKASQAINSDMSDADCEEIAKALENLATGIRKIPVIRKMINED